MRQPGVQDGDHAAVARWPAPGGPAPCAISSAACVAATAMKPLPPPSSTAFCRALISGSSGRGNGIRSMTTSWQLGPGHIDALPQRERAEQAGLRVRGEVLDQLAERLLALEQDRHVRAGRAAPRRPPGRPASRRTGPSVRPPAASTSSASSSSMSAAVALPAGRRQVLGDVEDALLAVVEGRADVEALPLRAASSPSVPSGARPREAPTPLKSPPSLSVAEVRTTERSAKSFSRSRPDTDSGATRSEAPKRSWRSYQTTSYSEPLAMRSATSWIDSTEARACLRTASSSWTDLSRVAPSAEITVRAASRRAISA